jgi:hypothetical protein
MRLQGNRVLLRRFVEKASVHYSWNAWMMGVWTVKEIKVVKYGGYSLHLS